MGGHYIADMLGGVAVMLVSLALVRLPERLRQRGEHDVFAGAGLVLEQMEPRPYAELARLD